MDNKSGVSILTEVALGKIKEMSDSSTVIGEPITLPNGCTAVPVSKVSYGFASGGSDIPNKHESDMFGGGTGGGITITPIGFLVAEGNSCKILQLDTIGSTADNAVRILPDLLDKVNTILDTLKSKKEVKEEKEPEDKAE